MGRSNTTALAERVGLDRSTIVRNLKPLLEKEFIEDVSDEGQRDRVLRVTEKGAKALKIGIPLWKSAQKEVKDLLGAEKLNIFRDVLCMLQIL